LWPSSRAALVGVTEITGYATYQFHTLKNPTGIIALNLRGKGLHLFISDSSNHIIRRFRPSSGGSQGNLVTVAGMQGVAGYADGAPLAAKFNYPTGMAGTNYTYRECQTLDTSSSTSSQSTEATSSVGVVTSEEPLPEDTPTDENDTPPPDPDQGIGPPLVCYDFNYQIINVNDSQNYVICRLRLGELHDEEPESVTTVCGTHNAKGLVNGASMSACFASLAGLTNVGSLYYVADA
jgi:hypothetical protein